MSQVSIIDIGGNFPQIPTRFNANIGFAIPIANVLEIFGTTVAAGTTPVKTRGVGNNITTEVQIAQAIAATNASNVGLSAYNSAQFTVDANGFVSLIGGGIAIDSVQVDAFTAPGTNPVAPTVAGLITVTGAQVASGVVGANVIRSNSIAVNTYRMEIQRSAANATTNSALNGVSHFNSGHFSVDANGFVSLTGGGQAIDSFTTDVSGPVSPDGAGNVAFTGATNIFSDGSVANTMRLNLQGTNHALFVGRGANTASANLAVGTNGQVLIGGTGVDPAFATITSPDGSVTFTPGVNSLAMQVAGGTTVGKTITGNTGGALAPTAGNWNILGNNTALNGFATYATGSGSTLTVNSFGGNIWVVNPTLGVGTHQTIQAAITAASAGDTVKITAKSTAYVENITGKVGVNLVADTADAYTPNVTISGTFTHNTAGIITCSGIRFQTNGASAIAVTGSVASILRMRDCYINVTNATGITYSSSSNLSAIIMQNCDGNIANTSLKFFDQTSAGTIIFDHPFFSNTGLSTTASTSSAGIINMQYFNITFPITTSGTSLGTWEHGLIDTNVLNVSSATVSSGSGISMKWTRLTAGTASAASIGGLVTMEGCTVASSNTNAITGAGALNYSPISFNGSSSTVNVTTQTPLIFGPKVNTPGITFDNNVNTLSNFSQGTFNAVVVGFSVAGAPTMTQQFARYQRVGRTVTVHVWVAWSTLGGATGPATINNLPFTVANQTASFAPSIACTNSTLALTANAVSYIQPTNNTTNASVLQYVGGASSAPSVTFIAANNGFTATIIYESA